ncbi:PLG [Mytilus edulis]|uniref:PLG n=1 Tax=Mytilus edulis TaxID=6550 RepID=A0A8S3V804_MYTED|nr:PLG [Mytilus edulis]
MIKRPYTANKGKVICQDSKTTLSYPSNQVIKITQATYGRFNKRTCKHKSIKTTRCSTNKPLGITMKNCNGRKSCTVAANNRLMDSNAFVEMFYEKTENERKVIAKRHVQEINDRYVEVHGGSLFIQYGFECFCGNVLRKDRKRKESDCKTPCAGNKRQICGGTWRISIYTGSAYIGCYRDDSKRILSKKVLKDKRMTVQKCQQFCGQKGFKYAGVEYGFECFCGNVLRKDRKRKESDCKTPCAGNKRQICGGTWRISIYTGSAYIGCYRDDSKRILSKKVLKDKRMTVQKCQQFCGQKGFKYAGVEYGFECFCGNVLRKDRKRKDSDCKTPCAGNKRQICGGTWRISIYTEKTNMASYAEAFKNGPKFDQSDDSISSVKPVFIEESDVFGDIPKPHLKSLYLTIDEMYKAIGAVVPRRSIKGLQRIRGLWRIYLDTEKETECLLSDGLELRGKSIFIYSRNPRVRFEENSTDVKIRVKDVPLSADDGQILRALEGYNCTILKHFRERFRFEYQITDCQTGDRIVICDGPLAKAIPKSIPIGKYRATVLYKGQQNDNIKCNKCMETGHKTRDCQNDWKCRSCGESGHRQNECTSDLSSNHDHEQENSSVHDEDQNDHCEAYAEPQSEENEDPEATQSPVDIVEAIPTTSIETELQQSQSILTGIVTNNSELLDDIPNLKAARPKVIPARRENNKPANTANKSNGIPNKNSEQQQITKFTTTQSSSQRQNHDTPVKATTSSGLEKSPVTPTEKLHDGATNNTQTSKCRNKCHKKAKCRKGKCVCKGNYQGDGVKSCKKVKQSAYIGCYQDHSKRILPKDVLTDKSMTVQKCRQFCRKKGFKYAGVENGNECFCGDVLRKNKKRKKGDCKTPCSGNKQQICGGPWRISIYTAQTSKCRNKCHKKAKCRKGKCVCKGNYQGDGVKSCKKVKQSAYIGCYQDHSKRILPKDVLTDKSMTVQKCRQFCRKKGFKYAGVENGNECFCGDVLRKNKQRKEGDCKTPCSGNKQQICGGPWRISIYTAQISKCRNKCHKKAKCRKGKCVCKGNYQGDGVKSCKKVKPSKRKVICEDSKTTLSCPSNQVIKITQATYGRSNKRTCKHPNMKTTRCVTKKPLGISRKNCNGRKSCTVAANNRLYGDPCPGTYKYVTVTYSCKVKKTPKCLKRCHRQAKCIRGKCVCKSGYKGDGIRSCTNIKASKRKVICEDSKTTLSCPSNQVIKITQATYGRSNKRTCKHPNMKTTRCVTKKPLGISRKNCNGRKSCTVAANNRLYGDPCPGTYKYVTVTYSCKVKKTPKCLRRCHRQAKCIRGKCVCKSRYKGDGIRSCTNIKAKTPCKPKCQKGFVCNFLGKCRLKAKTPCKPKCQKGFVCNFLGKCRPKGCKRKCRIIERCVRGKCRCKKGSYRTKLGACRTKTPCKPKCQKGFVCNFRGKCRPKGCKRKCRINERCVRGKCRCTKGSYRTILGACRSCERKCKINERCFRGKCRCNKGLVRTKLGACKTKVPCKPKCKSGFVCSFRGKCRPKDLQVNICFIIIVLAGCKRKCRLNERCDKGKCRCKKGSYRTTLRRCKPKTPCKPKCKSGFVCSFRGKCRPKVTACKRKCRINERCRKGKCRCKKGSFRTKLGTCKMTACKRKCRINERCRKGKCRCKKGSFRTKLGTCKMTACKRKCRINERCRKGKCRCKKGSFRTKLGTCKMTACKRKCRINERCRKGKCRCKKGSFRTKLGTCKMTACKRKCRINERCRKGKCRCKKGSFRTKLGTCKMTACKRKCRINERCRKGKCRCKKGSFRTKLGTCKMTACKRKCRINERCRKGKCRCKKGSFRTKLGTCKMTACKRKCRINERCRKGKCRCKKGSFRTKLGTCKMTACKRKCRINERCRKGKCRCKKGSFRTKLGTCKMTACKRKCRINERCRKGKCRCKKGSFRTKLGTCKMTACKRKCRINERCRKGKCRCKKGSFRTKLGTCKMTACKRKCRINERCRKGKCRCKKGSFRTKLGTCKKCKRKCRINERCVRGKYRCKKGSYRTKLGTCRTKTPCKPKCQKGFVCNFLGKCRPKGCKRKCRINERCVRGKCRCKKGSYRTKLGACRRCKRKCRINERCFNGKCRCTKGSFRTKLGTCKKRCNADSCGVNAVCVKRKDCRCKRGYAGHPKILCEEVKECLKNARGKDYNGRMSTTESGRTCQAWNKQTPHRHSKSNVRDAKNYYREHRTERIVPNAERINYIELKSGKNNPSCTFGVTYGFYGVKIWTKENCREKIKVCLTPKNRVPILPPPEECRKSTKGTEYKGRISLTKTGRTCQYWERQYPHKHRFSISFKKEHNYCRNPDNSGQPWCYTNDPTTRWEYCQIPMCECRKSTKGTEYKGRISLTKTGRTCQYWERQYPHKHRFSISFKKEHNYCRNPDNSGQPWCYTNDPTTRWEYCQIPMCECRKSTKGTEYKGRISLTKTGRTCQYWERQYPHKHRFSISFKKEHNYCRNPDNSGQPWCYTNDPTTRWEYCQIPMCAACSVREEIVECKATVRVSGSCFYKSKVGSSCVYTVQLTDSQAIIKTSTQEMVLTNGGNLAECAIFTFNDGTLKIEDDVCKCFEATVVNK